MKVTVLIFLIYLLNVVKSRKHGNLNPLNDGRDRDYKSPQVRLVKRIIPHGYKSAPFEYDSKSQTIFVPKYRVQKRNDLNRESELASTEMFLQPFKSYQTGTKKEELNVLKGLLNAYREARDDGKTNYYITPKKAVKKKRMQPDDRNMLKIQNIDYEKPWQQVEKRSEPSERAHKNKQELFKNLDSLLKTLQSSNNERHRNPKAEYSVYSDGPVRQTVQRNPRAQQKTKSYTIDELLKKFQNTEFEKPRHNSRYSKKAQMNSPESLEPYTMLMLKNEKSKPYNDLNNILKVIQNSNSGEQRRGRESLRVNLENNSDKKPIEEAVKYADAVIDGLERNEDKTKVKNLTKLLFKSMSTYFEPKETLLNKPSSSFKRVFSGLENAIGNSPWGSLKPPMGSELTESDVLNQLLHSQKPNLDGVNSDDLWQSINPNIERTRSDKLEILLERLQDLVEESRQSEETEDTSSEEAYWTPIEPPKKRVDKLEDVVKTLVGLTQSLSSDSESVSDSEEPVWPVEVIQKHKVQLLLPALAENEPSKMRPTSYENPKNDKLHMYVRNLGDLLKILKYVEGKKNNPQLRDRPTNSVVLDLDQSHKQHPFNFPHYSIWNYWTYDKNLFHDNCPGEQVKVGNKCIWTPPHRK